ncbi:unnamed protein product [Orchesella dallaii]|uniref:Zinc finger protein n=1 Tax=Orchesella dallaii TaxID=48710 RepID=A0ABP1QYU8_9HEXA
MARVFYCSFCYKACLEKKQKVKITSALNVAEYYDEFFPNPALQRFLVLLQTYLGESFSSSMAFERLNSCSDCLRVMESFCTTFLEMKCLESQLELKLQQLNSTMSFADTANSSHESISDMNCDENGHAANENTFASIGSFRGELQTKCKIHIRNYFVKFIKLLFSYKLLIIKLNNYEGTAKLATNLPKVVSAQQDPLLTQEFCIGWILSFIVVANLGTNSPSNAPANPTRKKFPLKDEIQITSVAVTVNHPNIPLSLKPLQGEDSNLSGETMDSTTVNPIRKRKMYPCKICNKNLWDRPSLWKHYEKCNRPSLKSLKEKEFDLKYINQTGTGGRRPYNCAICGKVCTIMKVKPSCRLE